MEAETSRRVVCCCFDCQNARRNRTTKCMDDIKVKGVSRGWQPGSADWAERARRAGPRRDGFGGYNASGSAGSLQLTRNTQEIHAQAFTHIALSPRAGT